MRIWPEAAAGAKCRRVRTHATRHRFRDDTHRGRRRDGRRYPIAVFETPHGFSEFVPGLAVRDAGRLELGWDAAAGLAVHADAVVRSIKREVGARRLTIAWASSDSSKRRWSSRRNTSRA